MKEKVYPNNFKTVKKGEGKEVKYELFEITAPVKEGDKAKETKIGENLKLVGAKEDARQYVLKKDAEATEFNIIHHKPGREKDAKENCKTKKAI
jgi:hypothetical protein